LVLQVDVICVDLCPVGAKAARQLGPRSGALRRGLFVRRRPAV